MKKYLFIAFMIGILPLGANSQRALNKALLVSEVHQLINQYRAQKGLAALKLLEGINLVAEKHSVNMAALKTPFGHEGFDTRSDEVLAHKQNPSSTGENVFMGIGYQERDLASIAVDAWIQSRGHRENIEKNFVYTGIGIAVGKGNSVYFTQFFVGK